MSNQLPLQWQQPIEEWALSMRASRLTTETISLRTAHIRRLGRAGLADIPWQVTATQLIEWTGSRSWRRETARAMRSSLRRFWAWGRAQGHTAVDPTSGLPEIRPDIPNPRPASPATVRAALRRADDRVSLMLRLANDLGMRRSEVAQVHPGHDLVYDATGWSLIVHGKGLRNRVLPLPDDLAEELTQAQGGFLFPSPAGGHLSPHWVGILVSRALGDGTTMHQLRHLCATEVHDATHDVRLVQTMLGHASLATTQRYLAVDDVQMRSAIADRSVKWKEATTSES